MQVPRIIAQLKTYVTSGCLQPGKELCLVAGNQATID
ncbi:Uncharacterised protein [Legionella bozemanae]|nr:Uncharacterised protein [Legionella bozemanae]